MSVDNLQFTLKIKLEFPINEKDFFVAGEAASKIKKHYNNWGFIKIQ